MAYEKIKDVIQLANLTELEIKCMNYKDDAGVIQTLRKGDMGILRAFTSYIGYMHSCGDPIGEDWSSITIDDFDQYRIGPDFMALVTVAAPQAQSKAQAINQTTSSNKTSLAKEFMKGSKRDPSHFTELRNFTQWDNWDTEFSTLTKVQNCASILDETYMPSTTEEQELFEKQQLYMYSVLMKIVKVDEGKAILRKEKASLNAQNVYAELRKQALKSTAATLNAMDYMQYITSAKLGPKSTWVGTTSAFLNHWMNQVKKYDDMGDPNDTISDVMKLAMVQNTVRYIPALDGIVD